MADITKTPAAPKPDASAGDALSAREQLAAEIAADPFWEAQRNPEAFDGTNVWINGRPPVKPNVQPPADGAMK